MNKKNVFDILENAEDEIMKDLTDMGPDIDDEKLEKLLGKCERDYKIKKKEKERTMRENNIIEETVVSGVDRVKRPIWVKSMVTAASMMLIAGVVIGSVAFMHGGSKISKGGGGTPTVTAVTTDKKSTETTVNASSAVTTTSTQATTTVSTSAQEAAAETNVQVVGVPNSNVTTAVETPSQVDTFVGRLNQSYQENYRNLITNMVDEAVSSGESLQLNYALKDLTGDGTPELIIKHGRYDVESSITVYNPDLKVIGDMFRGSYTGFYESSSGALTFVTAHMGYFCASYPVYDAASDNLSIGTQNEREYGAYGSYEDVELLIKEEGLTAMNDVGIWVDRGSVSSYYGGQTFDYPYFGIIV
ncbi:MAG: hypothetical protein K6G33_01840 [Ruminococcus sp.]|uniref:hypothetical protein n=1 Tax=Ruminococcus sp. TaxID=41978 RepID=UPI0025DA0F70|nr:hypothetical protein [Ruminococcus sp.]MCR5599475.1 hypothetical protein [Ruminococcus sp.]